MAKIKAPISFSQAFSVSEETLEKLGVFNPIINVDTPLFIDPTLLKSSSAELIHDKAPVALDSFFGTLITLLSSVDKIEDLSWRQAQSLLAQREVQGTCLGFGVNSISGRRLSKEVQRAILSTALEIIRKGIVDPELFLLLPLFEEGIGPDSISDITATAIEELLLEFTAAVARELRLPTLTVVYKLKQRQILKNPFAEKKVVPVLLLPKDILRDLPIVSSWEEVEEAASFNNDLRTQINFMIGSIFQTKSKILIAKAKRKLLEDENSIRTLIKIVQGAKTTPYDLEADPNGLVAWHKILGKIATEQPLKLEPRDPSLESLQFFVRKIIEQFKFLIEKRGLNRALWNTKKEHNLESTSQLLFFATAYSYCKANDIDINPEMDAGVGYIDFKFSQGFKKRVVVEIKHSYNANIEKGFNRQLKLYKDAEETCYGFYVIVDVGGLGKKLEKLEESLHADTEKLAQIYLIDGTIKPSASKG